MYNKFFGFKENPFNQTPDSGFFFESLGHKTALDALLFAIRQRKGFVVITGEVGAGKTTIARTLLRKLDRDVKTALVTNTTISPKGILTLIMEDLGIHYRNGSKDKLLIQLNNYLLEQMASDQNVVLMIDEAQNLSPACLEEVRMLSNLETEKEKLIQIILLGQPELRRKLELSSLAQLKQRISIQYHLNALSPEDTKNYIVHRLNHAKLNGEDYSGLFPEGSYRLIYEFTKGIPRVINNLCDHSLLAGYIAETKKIDEAIVRDAMTTIRHG
ncbi:MAG: AAA family ATPase [Candidatus Omnitrophica bacterium]|nr:AAA family ATPase [Candidatus Omnitrophota bacterium]